MTAIQPKPNGEVKVDIIEEQNKQTSESTSKSSTSKSRETTNRSLCKHMLKTVIYIICFCVFECEMILFSGKTIATLPTDVILYRYQILGCCLLLVCGFIVLVYTLHLFGKQIGMILEPAFFDQFVYYCTRNERDSMRWYQRKRFVRIVLVIGLVLYWLLMFEVGHLLYVINESITKTQLDWNRPMIYSCASLILFGFGLLVVVFLTLGIVIFCFVEPPMNDSTRSCSNNDKK